METKRTRSPLLFFSKYISGLQRNLCTLKKIHRVEIAWSYYLKKREDWKLWRSPNTHDSTRSRLFWKIARPWNSAPAEQNWNTVLSLGKHIQCTINRTLGLLVSAVVPVNDRRSAWSYVQRLCNWDPGVPPYLPIVSLVSWGHASSLMLLTSDINSSCFEAVYSYHIWSEVVYL